MRVAYLQGKMQLARVSPEEFGFDRPETRLPFNPVSRQPALTSDVIRKRLPFSTGVIIVTLLGSKVK